MKCSTCGQPIHQGFYNEAGELVWTHIKLKDDWDCKGKVLPDLPKVRYICADCGQEYPTGAELVAHHRDIRAGLVTA